MIFMRVQPCRRIASSLPIAASFVLLIAAFLPLCGAGASQAQPADPWIAEQLIRPADFAQQLTDKSIKPPPTIVCVGFHTLYRGGHISGSTFHGTASSEQGLAELKKWAATLSRSTNLVIYCGCCPFDRCPNVRPAFRALHEMGFTHLRVLDLPTDFATDWAEKGYPMEKGE
jgi:thiosulfate/3-mercaptopyruvate sulfurtransferase